jgi:hypothetical protein
MVAPPNICLYNYNIFSSKIKYLFQALAGAMHPGYNALDGERR